MSSEVELKGRTVPLNNVPPKYLALAGFKVEEFQTFIKEKSEASEGSKTNGLLWLERIRESLRTNEVPEELFPSFVKLLSKDGDAEGKEAGLFLSKYHLEFKLSVFQELGT